MGLSNKLSCEAGHFSCCCLNLHRCFQSEALRLYFPALEPWAAGSVSLPSCSSPFIHMQMWGCPVCQLPPCLVLQPLPCHEFSPPWLPISAPPTVVDECLFFISLVVPLPCCSILCQVWLCKEAQCVYLRRHLGSPHFKILDVYCTSIHVLL